MVVLPFLENIVSFLENWVDGEGSPMVVSYVAEVQMETSRGRAFARDSVLLADFPWDLLSHFRRTPSSRGQDMGDVLRFKQQNTILRPNANSVWEASENWIANPPNDEAHFQEYVTAAEEENEDLPEDPVPLEDVEKTEQADIIQQLQARLLELESRSMVAQSKAAPAAPSRNLFTTSPQGGAEHQHLVQASGSCGSSSTSTGKVRSWNSSRGTKGSHVSKQFPGSKRSKRRLSTRTSLHH